MATARIVQRVLEEHVGRGELVDDPGVPGVPPEAREPAAHEGLVVLLFRHAAIPRDLGCAEGWDWRPPFRGPLMDGGRRVGTPFQPRNSATCPLRPGRPPGTRGPNGPARAPRRRVRVTAPPRGGSPC
jgi:hypothetical protein